MSTFHPLPTLDQFRRAHQSLWQRPAELAQYEYDNRKSNN